MSDIFSLGANRPFLNLVPNHVDDRGVVYCPFDNNGKEPIGIVKRTYVVSNWDKGRIRAWHGHNLGWTGIHVICGVAKVVAIPIAGGINDKLETSKSCVLSEKNPGIFWIPPGWYNGTVSLCDNTKILVYSTLTFEEVKTDDVRKSLTSDDVASYFKVVDR